jgi:bifunctional DNA-binding transcriptional regulator/antitoxin component of YhaV-PrlF toxin-antitoxin module
MKQAITTRIVGKFQTTVPPEIREIFDLREGDLLDWMFDNRTGEISLIPKRAQLITPQVLDLVEKSKARKASAKNATSLAQTVKS